MKYTWGRVTLYAYDEKEGAYEVFCRIIEERMFFVGFFAECIAK